MADLSLSMQQDIGQLLETATSNAFRVFVSRIPMEINKDGLTNIFGKCGQVIDVTIPVGRNVASPFKTAYVTFPTRQEAQEAVENIHNRPPFCLQVNHAMTSEEKAQRNLEERRKLENGAEFAAKLDEFHKTKGRNDVELSAKNRKLAEAAVSHAVPRLVGGVKGLPANHQSNVNLSGYSSGGEDEWMQIQGFIRATPVSKEDFDRRPYMFNHPMILPYAPMEVCSYCGKDGLVRCSRCRDWYCGETCQKNHWPTHKLNCKPPPQLEKRDGTMYKPPSRTLRQPITVEEESNGMPATKKDETPVKPEAELPKVVKEEEPKVQVEEKPVAKVEAKKAEDKKVAEKEINDVKPTQIPSESSAKMDKKETETEAVKKLPSKKVTIKSDTFKTSILKKFKVGDTLQLAIEEIKDASRLSGMVLHDADFETLLKMEEECTTPIDTCKKGDIVVVSGPDGCCRALITDVTEKEVSGVDIDWPKWVKVPKNKVFGLPAIGSNIMAAGFVGFGLGSIPKALTKMLRGILTKEGYVEAKVTELIPQSKSLRVTLFEGEAKEGKALLDYILHTWHKFDKEIPTLLGLERSVLMLKDLDRNPLKVQDEVIYVDAHSSFQFIVWLSKDVEQEMLLSKELEVEGPKQAKVQDPNKGELVICQWSDDDSYYRAVINDYNKDEKKVKLRFVDYGNQSVEPLDRIRELPDTVIKYPIMAKLLALHGIPEHSLKDVGVKNRLKQLEPLFQSPMTITKEEKKENGSPAFIVEHVNGKTINDIIKAKLKEESDTVVPSTIQGAGIDGQFNYDKAHICELKSNPGEEQTAYALYADSPQRLFFCPANQIGIAEKLGNQIENYAKINENMTGFGPGVGKLCLAKSNDDGSWYRGACLGQEGDTFEIFFVDYGFKEFLPRTNLKVMDPVMLETPFLANHCILEGFEDEARVAEYTKDFGAEIQEKIECFSDHQITVVKKIDGYFVVRVPALKGLKPKQSTPKEKPVEEPKPVDQEKEEQIRKLREQLALLGAA